MTTYVATLKASGLELARSDKTQAVEGNVYVRPVESWFGGSKRADSGF